MKHRRETALDVWGIGGGHIKRSSDSGRWKLSPSAGPDTSGSSNFLQRSITGLGGAPHNPHLLFFCSPYLTSSSRTGYRQDGRCSAVAKFHSYPEQGGTLGLQIS